MRFILLHRDRVDLFGLDFLLLGGEDQTCLGDSVKCYKSEFAKLEVHVESHKEQRARHGGENCVSGSGGAGDTRGGWSAEDCHKGAVRALRHLGGEAHGNGTACA